MNTPKGAQVFIDGSFCKIGLRGMTFYYSGGQWIRSEKTAELVADKTFNFVTAMTEIKDDEGVGYEYKCKKGLFSVYSPDKETALDEARHYFNQYFEDGEYNA